ncbi:MAG: CoA transferase [Chloroflexi bacterium]|nr:CoA transferase [Chloroflexota bacterium]
MKDLKVLEVCSWYAGPYCGKLLADMGADVVKVEPPSGDPARRAGPFPKDVPHPERSGTFLYLNTNKLGITLSLQTTTGQKLFRELAQQADVLLEDFPPGTLEGWGLGYEALSQIARRLVFISITPFGQDGPYRDFKAYPLNTFHSGGEGYTIPGSLGWLLYSERSPLKAAGAAGEYYAGTMGAVATLMAIAARRQSGMGQRVDVSKQEALINLSRIEIEKYFNQGLIESRATRSFPIGGSFQCKDGFVQININSDAMWRGLVDLMGNPQWACKEEYAVREGRNAAGELINAELAQWALSCSKHEIYYGGQARGLAITPYLTPEEVYASPQLASRSYFVQVQHPEAGALRMPAAPYRLSASPGLPRNPAPLLGQHNQLVFGERLGYSAEDLVRLRSAGVI